ncbi:MAG: glycosyl hydrolase family 43 [Bacteroides sp. SM23_62]|nr:MAG: glycosyl hydrolase family 43 [Bacteroides sp. SM23_62]
MNHEKVMLHDSDLIRPGKPWMDVDNRPINAHGGGFLIHEDTVWWYGEIKDGETWEPESIREWNGSRVEAKGINCYWSVDLINWKLAGNVLKAIEHDSAHDLHSSKVLERPKVIFNDKTGKFVMWLHIDSQDYSYSRAGVAISDSPRGPFKYIESIRPNGQMSRDQTLFKDDDGRAYHIYASEENMTMHVSRLSDDYLSPSGEYKRIFIDRHREAPAFFKHDGKYFAITSGCTGWDPNPAEYAVTDDIMGEWKVMGDPCIGDTRGTTFDSQGTYVLPFSGKYIFMADRWQRLDLENSTYVWLPMEIENDKIHIKWYDQWSLNQ